MKWGQLYLCGDAAHIVRPTGAKGLNLAVSDVYYLSRALIARYATGQDSLLARLGRVALARIWQAMRFSSSLTTMLHRLPGQSGFDRQMQVAELENLATSPEARRVFALNCTLLPFLGPCSSPVHKTAKVAKPTNTRLWRSVMTGPLTPRS